MFKVKRLSNNKLTVDIECSDRPEIYFFIPVNLFNIFFKSAYCLTVHSSQGLTIKDEIPIHEFSKFDNRMRYVSISRCKSVNQLNFL